MTLVEDPRSATWLRNTWNDDKFVEIYVSSLLLKNVCSKIYVRRPREVYGQLKHVALETKDSSSGLKQTFCKGPMNG